MATPASFKPDPINPAKPRRDLLDRVGGAVNAVFPGKQIGESLVKAGANLTNLATGGQEKFYANLPENTVNVPRLAADVASAGLTTASFGGLGTAGSLAARTAKGAALGAGLAGTSAAANGKPVSTAATAGAVIGGAFPVAGVALGAAGRSLTQKAPRQLVNYAYRVPAKQASKELNEAILRRGYGGKALTTVLDETNTEEALLEKQIQERLLNRPLTTTDDFVNDLVADLQKRSGSRVTPEAVKERVARFVPDHAELVLKKELTEQEANILRRAIDVNLKEATFMGKELTNEQKVVKSFADSLRALVKKRTGTAKLFERQSEAIGIRNLASDALDKIETQGRPGFLDLASGAVGFGGGGIPGAMATIAAQRAIRNPRLQGALGQGLRSAGKLGPGLNAVAPAVRTGVLNAVGSQARSSSAPMTPSTTPASAQSSSSMPATLPPASNSGKGVIPTSFVPDGSPVSSTKGATTVGRVQIPKQARLAYVNNNPGNLKFVGQTGAVKGEKGFARFPSPAAGFNALVRQVKLDASRGLTLAKFIHKFAPPTENNTKLYISQLASRLGVNPATPIARMDAVQLAKEVARKESSSVIA